MSGYQDVPMTRRRAQLLEEYASKLADMLEAAPDDKDLAEWVQSKIDRAAAAIQSAYHYLDQEDESELEKAVGHKYTHRKLIGRDSKTGRARYRYYYAEHQGGGISRAKFEAGSAFKLTWKGRRGHFHIDRVEGDQIFITHDSRPDMEPVPVQADELRALLTKQHSKAEQRHVEKRQREVEEIKRRAHRGGLGLALHRLRQAAAQAGVSLPEQYQRQPEKTRAPVAETAREVETPEKLRAEFKRKIEAYEGDHRLYVELFNTANYSETLANVPDSELFEHPITQELFSLTVGYPDDPVYIYGALKKLPPEYTKRLFTELLRRYKETGERPISEGAAVGILQAHQHHFEQSTAPAAPPPIEEKEHPLLGLKTLDLDPQQVRSSYRNISHTAGQRAESERREWAETLDQLEAQAEGEIQAGASREEVKKRYQKLAQRLLRTKQSVISARARTASSAITGAGQFNARQAQKRQQTLERREAEYRQALQKIKDTQPPAQTTPRDQLTSTAQQIIEDANQEHAERHEEHQEITRFELGEHTHTKTGAKLYTAKQTERVERDEYFRRVAIAKKHGGRYERRYVRGFVFKTAEDARAFALEVEGAAQEAPETSAETVTPHDEHPGADNFETMPEVESFGLRENLKRKEKALDLLRRSEQEDELKGKQRAKSAGAADKALMRAVREVLKRPEPMIELDDRDRGRLFDSLFFLEDAQRTNKYMNAQRSKEARQRARATIKEILDQQVRMISEALNPTPIPQTPAPEPTTPSTRPTNLHSRSIKGTVDQALSSEPTGISLNDARSVLPSKGDLRQMLSQEQRLKRAKEDLVSTGAPNFLGQKNPIRDITYALHRYLNGPYVELGQRRIREMERGLKIALRDARGEDLEQVKDEIARFWREWGGEYKRLQRELVTERTEGEALRNIRPLIPDYVLTPEINQLLDQMERELDQRPVTGHDIARWIDTKDTNQATRDRQPKAQPTTPREQLTETAREVAQGADNFETMPEVESARATTATVRDVQSTLKVSRRADKLTSTGRRARASINADKELIEAAQRALDEGYKGMESPAFIPLNERTPRQANYQRLKGALNGFKSSQTLTRGSWTDDHKSLQKKRIKARDQLDEALKELDQIARSQEQAQVSIEDLPPKGQRTLEDAKRFFGEPRYFERIEGSKTKRYVIYERDGHRIVGPASGRGKGQFSRSFSWDTPRYRREIEQGNIVQSFSDLTYQQIGDYDTLDEALTRTVNQYRSQDEMIDKLIEKEKERLAQGREELERLNTTPREQLTETARVTSDQTAEQATTRATPRPSEETLRGSGELDEAVRANLQDRAQFLTSGSEDTTKTGMRSKAQKAKDGELLLIHRRLQSDAQERLGPTAPRFADYSQLIGMPRADQPESAETRAQFRTALKDAIRELEQATSGQVTKSARPLITYRAQLIQTVERLTAA